MTCDKKQGNTIPKKFEAKLIIFYVFHYVTMLLKLSKLNISCMLHITYHLSSKCHIIQQVTAVSNSITAPQYYRGRFNPKKLYRGCGVRLRCLLRCAGVVCSVQVRCAACRCGVQLIVVRDFLCLWHSSEDNLGDKTSRTSPFGGTTLKE